MAVRVLSVWGNMTNLDFGGTCVKHGSISTASVQTSWTKVPLVALKVFLL